MPIIPLTQGQEARVGWKDYQDLKRFRWFAHYNPKTKSYYAAHQIPARGGQRMEYMHRRIMGLRLGDKLQVDHKNHDTLDNRRSNLRITNNRGNHANRKRPSKYGTGVYRHTTPNLKKPYYAQVWLEGRKHNLCFFSTPAKARAARRRFIKEHT